ncbi:protein of unknown function [Paraburkholderia kururiensis]
MQRHRGGCRKGATWLQQLPAIHHWLVAHKDLTAGPSIRSMAPVSVG